MGRELITTDRDQLTAERDAITVERPTLYAERNGWDGASSLDFADTSNKYIDFGNSTAIKALFDGTKPFSVRFWLKLSSSGGVHVGKFSNLEDVNGRGFLVYSTGSSSLNVLLRHLFTGSSEINLSIGAVSVGTWFGLTVTYDGGGLGAGLLAYVNGLTPTAGTGTLAGSTATDGVLSVGNTYTSNQRLFNVRDYAIWDRCLSRDEVIEVEKNNRVYNLLDAVCPPNVRYYPILSTDDITSGTGSIEDLVGGVNGIPRNTTSANLVADAPTNEPHIPRSVFRAQFQNFAFNNIDLRSKDVNGSLVTIVREPKTGVDGAIITEMSSSAIADGFNEGVQYTTNNPILSSEFPDPQNCILFVENQFRYATSNTNAPVAGVIYGDRFGAGFELGANLVSTWITPTASADEGTILTRSPLHRTYGILTIPPSYSITGFQGILNYSGILKTYGATIGNNTGSRSGNILTGKWTYCLCHDVAGAMATEISTEHKFAIAKLFTDSDPTTIDADWTDIKVSDLDIANPVGSFGSQSATLTQNGNYIDVSTTGDNTLNDGLGECINYKLIGDPVGWGDGKGKYLVIRVETITAPSQDANGFGAQITAYDGDATNPNTNACIGIGVKSNTNGSGEWCPTMSNSTTNGSNVNSSGATCIVYGVMPVWGNVGNASSPSGNRDGWMTGEHAWSYNTVTDAWINPDSQSSSSGRVCTGNPDQLTGPFRLGVAITTPALLTTCTFTVRLSYKVMEYPQPFAGIDY
jgi:hypothetical protein